MTRDEFVAALVSMREAAGLGLAGGLAGQLTTLANKLDDGTIDADQFERYFLALLTAAYLRQVAGRTPTAADFSLVGRLVERQRPFVRGFAADITAKTGEMPIATRIGMYADTVHTAKQAAVVGAALTAGGLVEWRLEEDGENCEPCLAAADGGPYRPEALPGLPGVICDGGPRCRCEIVPIA